MEYEQTDPYFACALAVLKMEMGMPDGKNPLARELAYYEGHKSEWLPQYENQFVVVAGEQVAGFYRDYETAWDAGTRNFGLQANFLIKQICMHEPVYFLY